MEKRVQDYSKEILKIIRSNTSPAVMGGRLQDYHENDLADVMPKLTVQERCKLYRILDTDMLSDIFEYTDEENAAEYLNEMDVKKAAYDNNSDEYDDFPEGEHYLQLSQTERDMVDMVCSNFDNVIVIYNGANQFELGFADEYPQIKSVVWCPGTGNVGFNALGKVFSGEVNPSGKTPDILSSRA